MRYIIAIDLGATNIKIALVNSKGEISRKRIISTGGLKDKSAVISVVADSVQQIIASTRIPKRSFLGVGVGVPGLADVKKGLIHYLVNIKGWRGVPLKGILEKRLRLPVFVDNDVNVMTLGEAVYGAGKGYNNFICMTLGTGVGGGIVIDGLLYRGSTLSAGEIGHMPIEIDGPSCDCGGKGCLERYVGNKDIVRRTLLKLKEKKSPIIDKLICSNKSRLTPEILSQAASMGDKTAIEIWKETGYYIGIAMAGIVNLLNPELIIIGGGVACAGNLLFTQIRKTIRMRAMELPAHKVKVVPAALGENAGLIGAFVLVERSRLR